MSHKEVTEKEFKEKSKGDGEAQEAALDAFLVRLFRELLVNGRRIGIGGAMFAALGTGTYSMLAPEEEARTAYSILRPVVQQTANDVLSLHAQVALLKEQQAELKSLVALLVAAYEEEQRQVKARTWKRKSPEEQKAGQELAHIIERLNEAAAPPPPTRIEQVQMQLPDAPWEKEDK